MALLDKKIYYILGTIFVVTSGIIYTFERFITQYSWAEQSTSISQNGSSATMMLVSSSPLSNLFIPIFIISGVVFFFRGYTKK